MFAWGATAALVAMVLAVAPGGGAWGSDAGSWRGYLMHGVATLLLLAPAAIAEELTFRGAPLILFASALGRGPATIVMAVLFALAHAANPNVTLTGLVNIGLAGVVLAMAVFSSGGLAAATGLHLGWNAGLAWLDAPVSGIAPATPLIDFLPGTPAWWTGGAFGPEGGLAATVTLGAMGWLLHRFTRKDTE